MNNTPTLKAIKKEFKPKPWLRKPDEEKMVQGYYYVKAKHKAVVRNEIKRILKRYV